MFPILILLLQVKAFGTVEPVPRPRETVALLNQARALPAEFSAQTLLRVAASNLVKDPEWKRELIKEAFRNAARASLPYLQWSVDRADSLGTRQVRANGFEALTLQTGAVEAMLKIDSKGALDMFEEIGLLRLPKLTCKDGVTPDVSAYYQTASDLFERAFTEQERKNGDDVQFLRARAGSIESPSQVVPALKMATSLKMAAADSRTLLASLAGALERVDGSDRSYGADEAKLVPDSLAAAPEVGQMIPALRSYILRHVRGPRCTDNIPATGQLPKSAAGYNSLVAKLDPIAAQYRPIPATDERPKDEGTYERRLLWQSAKSKEILLAMQWLAHGNRSDANGVIRWTVQERSTFEWKQRYQDALKLLGDWEAQDENSFEEWFCMATDSYRTLVDLVQPGPEREDSMARYLALLERWYPTIPNHNLWFTQARQLLYSARYSADPVEKAWILSALSRSANPTLALYARLEAVAGPPQ